MIILNHKYNMISDPHKRLFTRIAVLRNFKSRKNVMESFFVIKRFNTVMVSFFSIKNFKF